MWIVVLLPFNLFSLQVPVIFLYILKQQYKKRQNIAISALNIYKTYTNGDFQTCSWRHLECLKPLKPIIG